MTGQVVRDYFLSFHIGRLKEAYKNGSWWIFLYFPVVTLTWFNGDAEGPVHLPEKYAALLPMLFAIFQAPLVRIALPKMMYLCPMDEKSRLEYVRKLYWFKVAVPVLLALVATACAMLFGELSLPAAALILAETVLLTLDTSILSGIMGISNMGGAQNSRKTPKRYSVLSGCETAGVGIGMLMMFALMGISSYGIGIGGLETWELICFLVVLVGIQLPLTVKIMTYLKPAFADALNYERSYLPEA